MSAKHTPGPWRQGKVLITNITKRWDKNQRYKADSQERLMVFSNFLDSDEGRSRMKVAVCDNPEDARLIASAPMLLEALESLMPVEEDIMPMAEIHRLFDIARAAIAAARGEV